MAGWTRRHSLVELFQTYALVGIFNLLKGDEGDPLIFPDPWPDRQDVEARERQKIRDLETEERAYYQRLLEEASIIA